MEPQIRKHFCCFSEAIREGAKIRPQHFGHGLDDARTRTCAFVAGIEAIVGSLSGRAFENYRPSADYPYLITEYAACPVITCPFTDVETFSLSGIVMHLNDAHRWTREQIADWLESEEEKLGFITLVETEASRSQTEVNEMVVV